MVISLCHLFRIAQQRQNASLLNNEISYLPSCCAPMSYMIHLLLKKRSTEPRTARALAFGRLNVTKKERKRSPLLRYLTTNRHIALYRPHVEEFGQICGRRQVACRTRIQQGDPFTQDIQGRGCKQRSTSWRGSSLTQDSRNHQLCHAAS